jgi:hypothetical protein
MLVVVEEHGRGRQLIRCRVWPRTVGFLPWLALGLSAISGIAVAARAWTGAGLAGALLAVIVATVFAECGHAVAAGLSAFETMLASEPASTVDERATAPRLASVATVAMEET